MAPRSTGMYRSESPVICLRFSASAARPADGRGAVVAALRRAGSSSMAPGRRRPAGHSAAPRRDVWRGSEHRAVRRVARTRPGSSTVSTLHPPHCPPRSACQYHRPRPADATARVATASTRAFLSSPDAQRDRPPAPSLPHPCACLMNEVSWLWHMLALGVVAHSGGLCGG